MKELIESLVHEFIYGGHLLSLGAASIVWSMLLIIDAKGGWIVFVLAYLISQIVYNYDHIKEGDSKETTNQERTKHLMQYKTLQIAVIIVYILTFVFLLTFTNWEVAALCIFLVFGGIMYTHTLKKLTKKVAGFKSFYVSILWGTLVFLPLFYYSSTLQPLFVVFFIFVFVRLLVNTIFFDIKDIKSDSNKGFQTFPILFGVEKTIFYLQILNACSGLLLLFAMYLKLVPAVSFVLLLFPVYGQYYLTNAYKATHSKIKALSYIIVDGEYILWPFALLSSGFILRFV